MIPRYSLYLTPSELHECIVEDVAGHWLKWTDVMDYIAYARAHGFKPPIMEVETTPQLRLDMVEDTRPEDIEDDADPLLDEDLDIYDIITGKRGEAQEV